MRSSHQILKLLNEKQLAKKAIEFLREQPEFSKASPTFIKKYEDILQEQDKKLGIATQELSETSLSWNFTDRSKYDEARRAHIH